MNENMPAFNLPPLLKERAGGKSFIRVGRKTSMFASGKYHSFILIECNYIFIFVANMERYGKNNRISPAGDRTEVGFRSILAEASDVSRGVCEAICRTLSPRFSKEEK
ncbi:hypothetical protein [uncultured Bacteroides sp.]|uniref:hypothetical protein n=1 Tax=uncultured Bacteroides sp. TaxID=162156 RepID=UPI00260412F1|nr:hypothetical protein [uncultured Bacteroides sp.]